LAAFRFDSEILLTQPAANHNDDAGRQLAQMKLGLPKNLVYWK